MSKWSVYGDNYDTEVICIGFVQSQLTCYFANQECSQI